VAKLQIGSSTARDEMREISFPDTMRTLYTHRKAILVTLGIFLAMGIGLSILPRRYEAQGTIWVEPGESSTESLSTSLASLLNGQTNDIVASEVLALQSRTLLLRVADQLDLVDNRQFWGGLAFIFEPDPRDRTLKNAVTRDEVYKKMTHIVDVENDGKDEIIDIYVTTDSALLSAKIANTLINDYLQYLFEMRFGATKRSSAWLVDQLGDLKQKVDNDQTELTKLQEQLGIVGFGAKGSDYIYGESLDDMTKAADDATVARIIAEAKYRHLKDSDPNLLEGEISVLATPYTEAGQEESLLATLRASQANAASTYNKLLNFFGPNYPEVQQQKAQLDTLNSQVDAEQKRILNQAELSYDAAASNEKMTTEKVEKEKTQVFGSRDAMVRFALLSEDYASDRALYEGLIQHLQEAGIESGLQAGDIDIVDIADPPGKPTILGPWLFIPGAIVGGLIVGIFLALWLGTLDRRINGPEQVEKMTGLPLLAQIPHVKLEKGGSEATKLPQLLVSAHRSHYAESIQSLRASLLLTKPGSAPKVILITSATPNEGKSTTVVNLAATFARYGARVLVIDCDLRRGTIAKRFKLSATKGLTSVLTRQIPLEGAIQEMPGIPGLFVLADGPRPPDPAVLIGSDEMRRVMDTCRDEFDLIILDSPPVLGIADGLHLGQLADSVILVVRENVSNRKAVLESATMMAASHLPVSGFVFNDVDPRASSYSYGYTYRDYYRGYYTDNADVTKAEVSE
jgi:polysaccharide biosynthesis transport protein